MHRCGASNLSCSPSIFLRKDEVNLAILLLHSPAYDRINPSQYEQKMPIRTCFTLCMLWYNFFFALLFSFATLSIGQAELPAEDLATLEFDSTDQSSLTDWFWQDTGVNELAVGKTDMFSSETEPGLDFAEASAFDMPSYSLFNIDQPEVMQVPSGETDLALIPLNPEAAPEGEECLVDGVDMLYKRGDACSVNLSKVKGRDPGLCPEYMNNIKSITCCCQDGVEYDPETYPSFTPCYLCKYNFILA